MSYFQRIIKLFFNKNMPRPKHLGKDSQEPSRVEGLLRLYSMEYCPYAQRTRLVLNAKNIPHDIVNINLLARPDWFYKIHPEGKVPVVLDENRFIVESLVISDYLDEKYPENRLYPLEPGAKQKDKDLIGKIDPVIDAFYSCLLSKDEAKTPKQWLDELLEPLEVFENELTKRNKPFFGGEKPGMVDYMLWPWAERAGTVNIKLGTELPLEDHHIPKLRQWWKNMRNHPVCEKIYISPEQFWRKAVQLKIKSLNEENVPINKL